MDGIAESHPGGVQGVTPVRPTQACNPENCEVRAHIGVFFDGTGNNRYRDEPRRSDSNVARLYRAYPLKPLEGYFPAYIPGVGTRFPEIGEDTLESKSGLAFGDGGESRILFGLLHVLNSMHETADHRGDVMFQPEIVKLLCSLDYTEDVQSLRPFGLRGGLVSGWPSGLSNRSFFLKTQGEKLADKIASSNKPRLVEVMIDVFGFSRGAAEARTFCNWLDELFSGSTLFGVKAQVRFLGIFDTVASVGMPASATGFTDGHMSWADAPMLRIPSRVQNCEHYISAHENRPSFPLDMVRLEDGSLQQNCRQYIYPGMHSDLGGGYAPDEQGREPGDDHKLSQIPLNDMYDAAVAAKVPLDKTLSIAVDGYDPFVVAPKLREAYDAWKAAAGGVKSTREWLLPYLAWRYEVRHRFNELPATQRADAKDRGDLVGAYATLLADIESIENPPTWGARAAEVVTGPVGRWVIGRNYDDLAPEAPEILSRIKTLAVPEAMAHLFSNYCHDSFAGFRPMDFGMSVLDGGGWESEGYLRWRVHYRGTDKRFTLRQQRDDSQVADGVMLASVGPEGQAGMPMG